MTDASKVAARAAFWKVDGVKMDLDPAGTASVFESEPAATTAVTAALVQLTNGWAVHRKTLAKGSQVKIATAVPSACVAYTKTDAPVGDPYDDAQTPQYMDGSKTGDRELFAGHYKGPGKPTDPAAPDPLKAPLTTPGNGAYGNIFVLVVPRQDYPGGWAIYTAYPKP